MKSGVYTITSLIDNKIMVGQSVNANNRMSQHLFHLKQGTHDNPHLQRSFVKYGESNFLFEILEYTEIPFLFSAENFWCNLLNSHNPNFGYNIKPTNPSGYSTHSKETRLKISLANTGKKRSVEQNKKQSERMKIFIKTPESNTKRSIALKGKIVSEETKLKMAISKKSRGDQRSSDGKIKTAKGLEEWLKLGLKNKKIIDLHTNKVYNSVTECINSLEISDAAFYRNIKGKGRFLKKFNLKYITNEK
jgi:group I intron endonuclease